VAFDPTNLPTRVPRTTGRGSMSSLAKALAEGVASQAATRVDRRAAQDGGRRALQGQCDLIFGEAVDENARGG